MIRIAAAVAAICLGSIDAFAETPPCPQIRIIVPFSAGGASDLTARLVAEPLGNALKKAVVIENKVGATGNIGTAAVAKSTPDGCTIGVNVAAILSYKLIFNNLGYDPEKDLVPIAGVGKSPSLILTSASSSLNDLKDLVALSKEKGSLSYATAGLGLTPHLAVEELARVSGAKFDSVFYRGAPDFMGDLITGRITFGSTAAANSMPLVREGKLKALAVMQAERSPLAPNVVSSAEQGMSPLDGSSHFLLFAPSATPKATVATLSAEIKKIINDPAIQQRLHTLGFDPSPLGSSDETLAVIRKLGRDLEPIVKTLNLNAK
ncbi:MAG: tripartite tricarboxylate transporter substrate binding protein [Xanthobacteraceae bacterium]|nr:tripartite tricarboxylate transporter substrate binding protein [Xanthobacteraceae bacterium]